MAKLRFSTKYLILLAGMVSTAASLAGGLVLYFEGLDVIEATVKEVARADVQYLSQKSTEPFNSAHSALSETRELLQRLRFNTRAEFIDWIRNRVIWTTFHNKLLIESSGIRGFTKNRTAGDQVYETVWHERRITGEYDWLHATYDPSNNNTECGTAFPCVVAYTIDPTSNPSPLLVNIYNYSDAGRVDYAWDLRNGDLGDTGSLFVGPWVWFAADGNPYVYMSYHMMVPAYNAPFFSDTMYFTVTLSIVADPWVDMMKEYRTEADVLILQLDKHLDSTVLAGNIPGITAQPGCSTSQNSFTASCLRTVGQLEQKYIDLIFEAQSTPNDLLVRTNGHWLIKTRIHKLHPSSEGLKDIYMLWMRPTSTVEAEMDHALHLLIAFVVGVFLFDFMIGLLEVFLIAVPMREVEQSFIALQRMDLDKAESDVEAIGSCLPIEMSELFSLRKGVLFAIQSLREYKAYLPQTLFVEEDVESESNTSGTEVSHTQQSKQSQQSSSRAQSVMSARCAGVKTEMGTKSCRGVVMMVDFNLRNTKGFFEVSQYCNSVSFLQGLAETYQGVVHSFSTLSCETLVISWNTARRCFDGLKQATSCADNISKRSSVTVSYMGCTIHHGNIGTATMRGFVLYGSDEGVWKALFQYAKELHRVLDTSVAVTDGKTAAEMTSVCSVVSVGRVVLGRRTIPAHVILGLLQDADVEWMYSVDTEGSALSKAMDQMLLGQEYSTQGIKVNSVLETKLLKALERNCDKEEFIMQIAELSWDGESDTCQE